MRDELSCAQDNAGGEFVSELAAYGPLDTCRDIMRAYARYRYELLKEKYERYEFKHAEE